MGIHLADQTLSFLQACLLGASLGLLYDIFRMTRIAVPTPAAVVFAEDILFFLLCAVTTFLFLLTTLDGVVRVFMLIGMLLGAVLYFMTLGRLVMKVSRTVIAAVKAVIRFLIRYLILPLWRIVYTVVSFLLKPIGFLRLQIKKSAKRIKFRLKVRREVVYNHLIRHLRSKLPENSPRENRVHGAQGRKKRTRKKKRKGP